MQALVREKFPLSGTELQHAQQILFCTALFATRHHLKLMLPWSLPAHHLSSQLEEMSWKPTSELYNEMASIKFYADFSHNTFADIF